MSRRVSFEHMYPISERLHLRVLAPWSTFVAVSVELKAVLGKAPIEA
jgi:hypothetical protein